MTFDFQKYEPLVPVDRQAELRTVVGAYLTPFSRRPAPSHLRSPSHFHTGAVYDESGALVPESQRWGGYGGDYFLAADDPTTSPVGGRVLGGTWLYLGNWMGQFGHWITETLPILWGINANVPLAGIICHPFVFGNDIKEWQRQLLDDAGAAGLDVVMVDQGALRVERLLVPTRPVIINAFAMKEAVDVWERVATENPLSSIHKTVFLSISSWRESREAGLARGYSNHRAVDEVFTEAGFHVVAPETLSVREQVSLARGAEVLAGWSGSALHLSVFADSSTRLIELGDKRSGGRPVPHQRVLTAARQQLHAFVPATAEAGDPNSYELGKLRQLVGELGAD